MIMPGIGTAIGAVAGAILGSAMDSGGGGQTGGTTSWRQGFGGALDPSSDPRLFTPAAAQIQAQEQLLMQRMGISDAERAQIQSGLAASGKVYSYSGHVGAFLSGGGAQQIEADRLQGVAQVLGKSVQELA